MQTENRAQSAAGMPIDGSDAHPLESPACHPTERTLWRYAANETGPQRKKKVAKHLEQCEECRTAVEKFRGANRRFRELERTAIAAFGAPGSGQQGR